jgi:hypothetical protein
MIRYRDGMPRAVTIIFFNHKRVREQGVPDDGGAACCDLARRHRTLGQWLKAGGLFTMIYRQNGFRLGAG